MRHLDLFSGIGGFALAASWVWGVEHEIVSFCEIEEYPRKVLKKHWPDVPCHHDIKTLRGDNFGTVDLLTGGFPCQPFSVAGKQGGSTDDRHLWPEMFRVIQEAKPTWIIGENVAGLINTMEFEQCFIDLESEGYEVQAFIIPACAKNAIHRRDRVWIIANRHSIGSKRLQHKLEKFSEVRQGGENNAKDCQYVPPYSVCKRQQGQGWPPEQLNKTEDGDWKVNRAFNALRWPTKPAVRGRNDGVSRRLDKDRLKGLGNAIVPQCVVPIMQAIKDIP